MSVMYPGTDAVDLDSSRGSQDHNVRTSPSGTQSLLQMMFLHPDQVFCLVVMRFNRCRVMETVHHESFVTSALTGERQNLICQQLNQT